MATGSEAGGMDRRGRILRGIAWLGVGSVAMGYLLEWVRQRGDCDGGDKSPDTLVLSILLIVLVGGSAGIIGLVGGLVSAPRRGWTRGSAIAVAGPAVISLAGCLAIFVVAGEGPSTWFQYCAT